MARRSADATPEQPETGKRTRARKAVPEGIHLGLTLTLNGKTVTLTHVEAQELYDTLGTIFGAPAEADAS